MTSQDWACSSGFSKILTRHSPHNRDCLNPGQVFRFNLTMLEMIKLCANHEFDSDVNVLRARINVVDHMMRRLGMFALSDMLAGGQPIDRLMVPVWVVDPASFLVWFNRREREMKNLSYCTDDELIAWSAGHVSAFKMISNLLNSTPTPSVVDMERYFRSGYERAIRFQLYHKLAGRTSGFAADLALGSSAAWHSVLLCWRVSHLSASDLSVRQEVLH